MLYLATQFLWFLVAAFVVGFAMGWITRDGAKQGSGKGALIVAALLWVIGAALGWSQWLNGTAALWAGKRAALPRGLCRRLRARRAGPW